MCPKSSAAAARTLGSQLNSPLTDSGTHDFACAGVVPRLVQEVNEVVTPRPAHSSVRLLRIIERSSIRSWRREFGTEPTTCKIEFARCTGQLVPPEINLPANRKNSVVACLWA